MNIIWILMVLSGVICFVIIGDLNIFASVLISSSEKAVYFIIGLCGIMGVWSGLMNIAKGSGLISMIGVRCSGIMSKLFPEERNEETTMNMIMAFTANILGAGNSATVFSLKAMKLLDDENQHRRDASNAMCMFAAVNMSMLQLVPITIIQVRSSGGSASAEDIIIPSIIAGALSTVITIAVCKFYENRERYRLK